MQSVIGDLANRARQRWPELDVHEDRLADRLKDIPELTEQAPPWAEELVLADACGRAEPVAMRLFESEILADAAKVLRKYKLTDEESEDILQTFRVQAMCGPAPKISTYKGSGPLKVWVRVALQRLAIQKFRRAEPEVSGEHTDKILEGLAAGDTPELRSLKQHGGNIQQALEEAMASLDARDRTLLRMYFVDGRNIDAIAQVFGTHRATAARWLVKIRETLLDHIKSKVSSELGVSTTQFHSLVAVVGSDLHLTLDRVLKG